MNRTVRRAAAAVVLVAAVVGCSHGDDDDRSDDVAWCDQLDVALTATARLGEMERDDPDLEDALAEVQDEMAALGELPTPAAVVDDWAAVSGPVTTTPDGAADVGDDRVEAGRRIGRWALDHCQLSPETAAAFADGGAG